jgi:hypothetical protein
MNRRKLLQFSLLFPLAGCTTMKSNELFRIDGGDGDQNFFGTPLILERTQTRWFHGKVLRGEAMLFIVVGGKFAGEYVALTSRTMDKLDDQLSRYGWASVVVHRIRNPTTTFNGSEEDADPVGMSFVEIIKGS